MTGLAAAPSFALGPELCEGAVWIEPGGDWVGYSPASREILAFDVSSPGLFALQATTPGSAAPAPQLVALGRDCSGSPQGLSVLRRHLAGFLVSIGEPGTYYFAVAPQDRSGPLGDYAVTSRFMSWRDLHLYQAKEIDEEEEDPDPLASPGFCQTEDDHADTFDCATDLIVGEPVSGELHPRDVDTFTFELVDQATVRIESVSEMEVAGVLYDENGHRLAVDDDDDQGEDFEITKTLAAGRYYLTVEGRGSAEGPYILTSELVGW